jgi:Putative prokaryotic signal transducing protein
VSSELEVLTTVASEAEAELVRQRLAQAGIQSLSRRTIGNVEWGSSGSRYVYVEAAELERARALLAAEKGALSDEELGRLSEQARTEPDEEP